MKSNLLHDLDRWEQGDLSSLELADLHGPDTQGLVDVHRMLSAELDVPVPDPALGWAELAAKLPDPPQPFLERIRVAMRRPVLAGFVATAVSTGGAYAAGLSPHEPVVKAVKWFVGVASGDDGNEASPADQHEPAEGTEGGVAGRDVARAGESRMQDGASRPGGTKQERAERSKGEASDGPQRDGSGPGSQDGEDDSRGNQEDRDEEERDDAKDKAEDDADEAEDERDDAKDKAEDAEDDAKDDAEDDADEAEDAEDDAKDKAEDDADEAEDAEDDAKDEAEDDADEAEDELDASEDRD